MFSREMSIFVNVPADQAYGLVSDLRRHPEWAFNPLKLRHIAGPDQGVGAVSLDVYRHAGGKRFSPDTAYGETLRPVDSPLFVASNQLALIRQRTSPGWSRKHQGASREGNINKALNDTAR